MGERRGSAADAAHLTERHGASESVARMMRRIGYSQAQIGEALGVSRSTVKRLLNPEQRTRDYETSSAGRVRSPLALRIETVLVFSPEPLSPARICRILTACGNPTTAATVSVTLDYLKRGGKARNLGYGKWVATRGAEELAPSTALLLRSVSR